LKVLVTGAGSLLGGNLVRLLLENGFTVRALVDPRHEPANLDGLQIEKVPGDTLDPESTQDALSGIQAVFHCAYATVLMPPRAGWIQAVNYQGTQNLLMSMSRAGVEDLVHVGSASSFGFGTMDEPGTEESPYAGEQFRLACFDSMRRAQELVELYSQDGRIRGVIVNPTFMVGLYDPGDSPGREYLDYIKSRPGRYPSGGLNLIGAADAAAGVLKALGRGKHGRCYILGNHNIDHRELSGRFANALGVPRPIGLMGDREVLGRGLAGTLFGRLSGRKPAFSIETARLARTTFYYSSARAVSELDLPQSPLDTVIEDACRWYADKRR